VEQFERHPILGKIGEKLEKYKEENPAIRELLYREQELEEESHGFDSLERYTDAMRTIGILATMAHEDDDLEPHERVDMVWKMLLDLERSTKQAHHRDREPIEEWRENGGIVDGVLGGISKDTFNIVAEELKRAFPKEKVTPEDLNYLRHFDEATERAIRYIKNAEMERDPQKRKQHIRSAQKEILNAYERIRKIHSKLLLLQKHIENLKEYMALRGTKGAKVYEDGRSNIADVVPIRVTMDALRLHRAVIDNVKNTLELLKTYVEDLADDPSKEGILKVRKKMLTQKQELRKFLQGSSVLPYPNHEEVDMYLISPGNYKYVYELYKKMVKGGR